MFVSSSSVEYSSSETDGQDNPSFMEPEDYYRIQEGLPLDSILN